MAMNKHRKLFPVLETNQTDNSDPSCPYGCDPYSDFYFSPPPPSPPPPPPPAAKHREHVSPYIIIIVTFLGSVFLLLSYYAIMVKYRSRFRRSSAQSDGPDEEFLDHNHGPIIDHHIWYINTIGLQPSMINSITVVKYNKGDSLIEGTDCSVCLNEFQEDETLRLLPKCNHAFHIPCIDTWLRSHTNCPLCRAGIFSNTQNIALASSDQISRNLDSNENTQMENFQDGSDLERVQVGEGEVYENNRAETEEEIGFTQTEENSKVENELAIEKAIQPMRRSVSMDGAADFTIDAREFGSIGPEGSSVNLVMDSSSIFESLNNGTVSMKRSFSYGGRSVFSSH